MFPQEEHKQHLKEFWNTFGGNKNLATQYQKELKLSMLIHYSKIKIYYLNQRSLIVRRGQFNKVKTHRHSFISHKKCFVCNCPANVRHHIIQLQHGGINCKRNIVSLCNGCHSDIHPHLK